MRAVSLSDEGVLQNLKRNYVVGYKNITGASYAGKSGKHDTTAPAVYTTNGAGPHNVQLFFLSPDGVVIHCLLASRIPAICSSRCVLCKANGDSGSRTLRSPTKGRPTARRT